MAKKPKASAPAPETAAASAAAATPPPKSPAVKSSAAASAAPSAGSPFAQLFASYTKNTPQLLRLIDVYLACVMLSGIVQFVYVVLVGTFPYNSFLSGFIASVGAFVLAANLRMQLNPKNDFHGLSPEA
ncbi:hypothetical protein HDU82_006484 [Entophlyctis luteolus]|nr:hypothetical protein HDU82_006484 [Entophlyctis luteolus]KAJ3391799.1 hypothetical protein HDU84_005361 [Entophlyctis sp. JEL0112]